MPHVQANGIDIEYESFGLERDPLVLLIMGFGAHLLFWPEALCQALAARGFASSGSTTATSASRPISPANQLRTLARCLRRSWPGDTRTCENSAEFSHAGGLGPFSRSEVDQK
jgi:hypothetical protein